MKAGRKPLAVPRQLVRFYCRVDLLAEMELLLADPMRERAKYGARTAYLEALIEDDLRKKRVSLTTDPARDTISVNTSSTESSQEQKHGPDSSTTPSATSAGEADPATPDPGGKAGSA